MTLVRCASTVVLNNWDVSIIKSQTVFTGPPVPVLVLVLKSRAPLAEMLRVVRDPYHSASFNLSMNKTRSLESGVPWRPGVGHARYVQWHPCSCPGGYAN